MQGRKRKQKHQQQPQYKNLTPFKQLEKHFKLYQHQVTDYSLLYEPSEYQIVGGYKLAYLPFPQGCILVKGFNSKQTVLSITGEALNVYWKPPYRTNLDSKQQLYKQQGEEQSQKKENTLQSKQKIPQNKIKQQKKQTILQSSQPLDTAQIINNRDQKQTKGFIFNERIRWANVGQQYDWTARKYPNNKTHFPESISDLCKRANALYCMLTHFRNYYPQSAIINYYGEKDYMTGHLDDAEIDQISPIYSFSFGLSCVFLIGGTTKESKPLPVRLDSGDLLIMGGQSRKCYHGVPRIITNTYEPTDKLIELTQQCCLSIQVCIAQISMSGRSFHKSDIIVALLQYFNMSQGPTVEQIVNQYDATIDQIAHLSELVRKLSAEYDLQTLEQVVVPQQYLQLLASLLYAINSLTFSYCGVKGVDFPPQFAKVKQYFNKAKNPMKVGPQVVVDKDAAKRIIERNIQSKNE